MKIYKIFWEQPQKEKIVSNEQPNSPKQQTIKLFFLKFIASNEWFDCLRPLNGVHSLSYLLFILLMIFLFIAVLLFSAVRFLLFFYL